MSQEYDEYGDQINRILEMMKKEIKYNAPQ